MKKSHLDTHHIRLDKCNVEASPEVGRHRDLPVLLMSKTNDASGFLNQLLNRFSRFLPCMLRGY